jgi:hypothetical protein
MPLGVLLLTKIRWRRRFAYGLFANAGEASAGAADVASVAEEAVFRKSRRVNFSIVNTIVADRAGNAPAKSCAKALSGLLSPPIPQVVAAWNDLIREKLAGGS